MTWTNKVIWTEGMFLQPQHFQQHDRYTLSQELQRSNAQQPYGWGFLSLGLDSAALNLGKIAINAAQGLMPDGVAFDHPGPGRRAGRAGRAARHPRRTGRAGAGAAAARRGRVGRRGRCRPSMPPRYHAAEVDVGDTNGTGERVAPIQVGRLHLSVMLARDAVEGYATIHLCRVVERRADNKQVLDTSFIPPTLHSGANDILASHLRELHGMLHQRGEALAARLAQPGRAGVGEIADFLLLQTINRAEPLLASGARPSILHPKDFYFGGVQTGRRPGHLRRAPPPGRLARLPARRPGALLHAADAEPAAVAVDGDGADGDPDRAAGPQVRHPRRHHPGRRAAAHRAVRAGRGLATARRPYHAGYNYFELETRGNEMWKQLESSGGLAMHIAGDFPGLELEFWAVRG